MCDAQKTKLFFMSLKNEFYFSLTRDHIFVATCNKNISP